jgi:hypothetical protein
VPRQQLGGHEKEDRRLAGDKGKDGSGEDPVGCAGRE